MNADEIVKGLRKMATYDCGYEEQSDTAIRAADLIESLQADNDKLEDELEKAVKGYRDSTDTYNRYIVMCHEKSREIKKLKEELATSQRRKMDKCKWTYTNDYDDSYYETGCDKAFVFFNDGPLENDFIYCPYCGKLVQEVGRNAD